MAEKFAMPCECSFLQRPFRADALADAIKGLLDGPKARAVSAAWWPWAVNPPPCFLTACPGGS